MDLLNNNNKRDQISQLPRGQGLTSLLVKNTLWLLIDRAILSIGTGIAGLLLVRSLGPSNYGVYALAISTGSMVAALTDLGLRLFLVRNVAAAPQKANSYLSSGLLIKLMQLFLTVTLTSLVVPHLSRDANMNSALVAGIAFGVFLNIADLTASFFLGSMKPKLILLGRLVGRLGTIMIIALTIIFRLSVPTLLIFLCLLQVLVIILRITQLRLAFGIKISIPNYKTTIATFREAISFYLYELTYIAYVQAGFITLGIVSGKEAVGTYGAAFALVVLFPSLVYAGIDALIPVMTHLYEDKRWQEMILLRAQILETILLFSIPVVIVLGIYSNKIVTIFGKSFANIPVSGVLSLLAIHACLGPLEGLLGGAFLTATNQLMNRAKQRIVAVIVLLSLSCSLGWIWGAKGTAVAMVLADTVLLIGYARVSKAIGFPIKVSNSAYLIFVAAILMLCFALLFSGWLDPALSVIAAIIIYAGFLFITCRALLVRTFEFFASALLPHKLRV